MITAPGSWPRSKHVAALSLILVLGASVPGVAHRRDEYLQAARIAIEPDRTDLFLDLTPGIAVAEGVLADIDRDRSGSISEDELARYARLILSAVELDVDGSPLAIELVDSSAPTEEAMRGGEGALRVIASARIPQLGTGTHRLRYRNRFRSDIGVYLANALVPASDRIAVTAQRRDVDQRELTIEYTLGPGPTDTRVRKLIAAISTAFVCIALLWGVRRLRVRRSNFLTCDCEAYPDRPPAHLDHRSVSPRGKTASPARVLTVTSAAYLTPHDSEQSVGQPADPSVWGETAPPSLGTPPRPF